MIDFFSKLFSDKIPMAFMLFVFLGFLIVIILMVVLLMRANKKMSQSMSRALSDAQERNFSNSSDLLARKLAEYTDTILVDKVNRCYSKLVSQDLLPAVNAAAQRITELSEGVSAQQESGMKELAYMMADLMAERTRDYLYAENQIISSLNENVAAFAGELSQITSTISQLSYLQNGANEQTRIAYTNIADSSNLLSSKIVEMNDIMQTTTSAITQIQLLVNQNSETVKSLVDATSQAQTSVSESAELLSANNEKTSEMISNAVFAMQQNTELSAKTLVDEFGNVVSGVTQSISSVLMELRDISEKINASSIQFSGSIHEITQGFGDNLGGVLNDVTSTISKSVSAEYKKIVMGAEDYSSNFTSSINRLNTDLDSHISNLQSVTEQLNYNISTYKNGFDYSSQSFQSGLEKSISDALNQMDHSLAEILQRLVEVTINIQDAADALPKAVNAFKKEG